LQAGGLSDTVYSITSGKLDSLLRDAGIAAGDSTELLWLAEGIYGADTVPSSTIFSLHVKRDMTVGIKDITLNRRFLVYPNPFSETLMIETDRASFDFTISDFTGRTIMWGSGSANQQIDTRVLSPGVYFLKTSADPIIAHKIFKL
jgi:hypothetical protein